MRVHLSICIRSSLEVHKSQVPCHHCCLNSVWWVLVLQVFSMELALCYPVILNWLQGDWKIVHRDLKWRDFSWRGTFVFNPIHIFETFTEWLITLLVMVTNYIQYGCILCVGCVPEDRAYLKSNFSKRINVKWKECGFKST